MLYSKSKREVIHPRMCNTSTFSVPSNRKSYVITAHKCSSQLNSKRKFAQFHQVNLFRHIRWAYKMRLETHKLSLKAN